MPSTYSPSLKLELIQNGEQSGAWGQTTNRNISLIEQAVSGVLPLTLTGGDYTLSNLDGIPDEARNAVINCSGLLGAPANIIAPSVQKTYIVTNNTGANVTIKTSTGNGVTVLNTTSSLVYCDGTDFYNAVTINNVIGNQTISGNEVILGNVTSGGNLTVTSNVSSGAGNLTFTSNNGVITAAVNTGAYTPPTGTSAQRPLGPNGGMSRFNTDIGAYEIFNGAVWQPITGAYAVSFLLIAGGGGGGTGDGFQGSGGGGAGGYLANVSSVQPGTSYAITIGAGGTPNAKGANSTVFGVTALAGGAGAGTSNEGAIDGGSGGGQRQRDNPAENYGPGSGTAGQGFAGGTGGGAVNGGGGGGASQAGQGSNGGNGLSSSITGTAVTRGGGGGGGNRDGGAGGAGGAGGGGNGTSAGTANTGGGGGGGPSASGQSGGSGVCILSYPSASQRATGGNVTTYTSGGQVFWVHTFTTSGTFSA
jgi:hypothetical protein